MLYTAIISAICLLLGMTLGASWPWLAFWLHIPFRSRRQEKFMPVSKRRIQVLTWLLILSMVFGFGTGLLQIVQRATISQNARAVADYQKCTSDYLAAFQDAYEARADASIVVTQALDGVIQAVAEEDAEAFTAAVKHYIEVREDQQRERRDNPLPPLPLQVCGPAPSDG